MSISPVEVLIIDDCAEDREFIRSLLLEVRDQSYRVREAKNAADGARAISEGEPGCILLDYRLPDADGLFLLQEYTERTLAIRCPVVLITGDADAKLSTSALHYGAQDILSKREITAALLERVIRHAIVRFGLVCDREAAMSALRERERLLQMAQEVAGIGTFDWDLTSGETRFGGSYFRLYGLPADHPALSFGQWLERIHPEDRSRVQTETERALHAGRDFSYDFRVVWPDDTLHWLHARGAVVRSQSGKPVRATGVNVDVTASKCTEEALVSANVELQQFALTAGHDLQAPLRTVSVFTELLQRTLGSNTDQNIRQALHQVRAGAQRMQTLIVDLLEFARAGSAAGPAHQIRPLQNALEQAIENLHSDIQASAASIRWDVLPSIRSFGEDLVQVFQNLIGNSIKYRREGTAPAIRVSCTRRAGDWLIAVEDEGEGFDMSHASLIFQPFKRLVGEQIAGTGLGLAICKRIIERNGGQIWAESRPGAGASFFFTLPLLEMAASAGASMTQLTGDSVVA